MSNKEKNKYHPVNLLSAGQNEAGCTTKRLTVFLVWPLFLLILSCTNSSDTSVDYVTNNQEGSSDNASEALLNMAESVVQSDPFSGNGALQNYVTNNADALPNVTRTNSRYHAVLLNNDNNVTVHYNDKQGRLDAKRISFPFEFVARNIGIGTLEDSQIAPSPDAFENSSSLFMFAGIQVHVLDLDARDSAHFVVGHRGSAAYTVEGKNTVNGASDVNDAGAGIVPLGRADLRVIGHSDKSLRWYWQQPNLDPENEPDDWIAYRGDGEFPGRQANFGDEVYIGLITYAYRDESVPFVGTADSIQWVTLP